MKKENRIIPALILSAGIVVSVIIFTLAWSSSKSANQTVTVTGSAKVEVISDFAIIKGSVNAEGITVKTAYKNLQKSLPLIKKFLSENGIDKEKFSLERVDRYPVYKTNSNGYQTQDILKYVYKQQFRIESHDVNLIKKLSIDLNSLVDIGVDLKVYGTEYHYSKLDSLKVEIQAKAAENAKMRAEKIVEATGRKLGPLRRARMGVIQIRPLHSNTVSDYGYNDLSSIEKEIMAVVNGSFEIE